MKYYVCGFLFTKDLRYVALIQKSKPDWQKGLWNGIGGKVEPNETRLDAMRREFEEETEFVWPHWREFLTLMQIQKEENWTVSFFRGVLLNDLYGHPRLVSHNDEDPAWWEVATLQKNIEVVPNLKWLIPLAMDGNVVGMLQQQNWPHPV